MLGADIQLPGRHQVRVDRSPRRADDRFRPRHPGQPLPAAGRVLPGPVRPGRQLLWRRRRPCPAHLRLHQPALVHAGDPGAVQRRHQRGLPISCFLNEASDSLDGIVGLWNENVWLASKGGGIGSYWGNLRSIGEKVGQNGKTSGVIPFIRVMDSLTLAISQGSLRRGSAAVYLPVGASRDRGIHRDAPPDRRRSEPQGAQPASRHPGAGRFHARGRGGRAVGAGLAQGRQHRPPGFRAGAVDPHPDRADGDRRALSDFLRPREPRPAGAPETRRAGGEDLQPVQRDHAAHRASTSMASSAPRCAACPR